MKVNHGRDLVAIQFPGACLGEPLRFVPRGQLGVPCLRVAPSAAAGTDEAKNVAASQHLADDFAAQAALLRSVRIEDHGGLAARSAAGQAPGSRVLARL